MRNIIIRHIEEGSVTLQKIVKKYLTIMLVEYLRDVIKFGTDVEYVVKLENHPGRTQTWNSRRRARTYKNLLTDEYAKDKAKPTILRVIYDKNRFDDLSFIYLDRNEGDEAKRLNQKGIIEVEKIW